MPLLKLSAPHCTRRFDRGTLYCSPSTALLVQQQLRVKPGCIRCGVGRRCRCCIHSLKEGRTLIVQAWPPACPLLRPPDLPHATSAPCSTVKLNSPIMVEGVRVTFLVGAAHGGAEVLPRTAGMQSVPLQFLLCCSYALALLPGSDTGYSVC